MKVGVLALQGAFAEHRRMLAACGAETIEVRRPEQLAGLAGLVIPGGESTAIGRLMGEYGFLDAIPAAVAEGMAVLGTCAGLIVLAREVQGVRGPILGLMDITVCRNAYGRQRESFETPLAIPALGSEPFPAIFIRAPYVERTGAGVRVLATAGDRVVLVRQGPLLGAAFHPELTGDERLHRYFLTMADQRGESLADDPVI